jgi:hypothetical protein
MVTRKSTRLRDLSTQGPTDDKQSAAVNVAGKKRKLGASAANKASTQEARGDGVKVASSKIQRAKKARLYAQSGNSSEDKLSALPLEILNMVLDNVC